MVKKTLKIIHTQIAFPHQKRMTISKKLLSCYNLNSDEDARLSESDSEESEESADVIDNIPVNPAIYVARDATEWISHNSNVPGRFATRYVLRPSSGPTSFAKYVNVSFLSYKESYMIIT
ncbi:uncharacterized protein TNCV_281251 [Trichonephila clavipes]|nr:uncharacterized protein TNCV_281251 [Trichonephila clavipes]